MPEFRKYEAPFEGKMVWTDPAKQKEWDEMDPKLKRYCTLHLEEMCKESETELTLEAIVHVVNDLIARVDALEKKEGNGKRICKKPRPSP